MDNSVDAKTVKNWISDEDEIAFIDVREISQHTEGHPFFSVSIPFSVFEMNIEQFLPNKKVRVVSVSYTHLRAHETPEHLVCRLLLEKKKKKTITAKLL